MKPKSCQLIRSDENRDIAREKERETDAHTILLEE